MKFHEITLPVHEPARWTSWFETTLRRLGAARTGDTGDTGDTVQLGWTALRFAAGASDPAERGHHLAFAIPTGTIGDAASSIVADTGRPLLELDDDGTTVVERGGNWASHSVYFAGPENSVFELIEHADRPVPPAPQDAQDAPTLLGVAEIGRGVTDVAAAGDDLAGRHDGRLPHGFGDPARRVIAAYGDIDGAVVLARDDRPWYPTSDVLPATAEASFRGSSPGN
ncbi:hypothetical protein [Corynebacterium sp. AOP40-4SA-5]|uniref:hypothetical protein n=1 Tax=Corynebacterium sp. AOP40-4SA-5 TaxID=3457678 RepID=UPI004033B87D